jgi:glutamine phosphoribosylpyrophosphate amidotransferase
MCGICAVLLFSGSGAVELTKRLMIAQKHLGSSSSGVAYLIRDKIVVEKDTVPQDKLQTSGESWVAIGHGRLPSVGKICKGNAHPFLACNKEFALVHNGTFLEHRLLRMLLNGRHRWEGETDSEVLCHTIEEFAPRVGYKKVLQAINKERILLLTKDGEIWGKGDLTIVRNNNGVFIANEESAIAQVLGELEAKVYETKSDTVFRIKQRKMEFYGAVEKAERKLRKQKLVFTSPWYKYYYRGITFWSKNGKEEKEKEVEENSEVEEYWRWFEYG